MIEAMRVSHTATCGGTLLSIRLATLIMWTWHDT